MIKVFAAMLFAATLGSANAMPIVFSDLVDPSPDFDFNGNGGANALHEFSHNILDRGYNAATDLISGASLTLRFADESDDAVPESVEFFLDGTSFGSQTITSGGATFSATFSSPALIALLTDGVLDVRLENAGITTANPNGRSDFHFLDSALNVNADRPAAPAERIPEPNALALVALAFTSAGLVWGRRR